MSPDEFERRVVWTRTERKIASVDQICETVDCCGSLDLITSVAAYNCVMPALAARWLRNLEVVGIGTVLSALCLLQSTLLSSPAHTGRTRPVRCRCCNCYVFGDIGAILAFRSLRAVPQNWHGTLGLLVLSHVDGVGAGR